MILRIHDLGCPPTHSFSQRTFEYKDKIYPQNVHAEVRGEPSRHSGDPRSGVDNLLFVGLCVERSGSGLALQHPSSTRSQIPRVSPSPGGLCTSQLNDGRGAGDGDDTDGGGGGGGGGVRAFLKAESTHFAPLGGPEHSPQPGSY